MLAQGTGQQVPTSLDLRQKRPGAASTQQMSPAYRTFLLSLHSEDTHQHLLVRVAVLEPFGAR